MSNRPINTKAMNMNLGSNRGFTLKNFVDDLRHRSVSNGKSLNKLVFVLPNVLKISTSGLMYLDSKYRAFNKNEGIFESVEKVIPVLIQTKSNEDMKIFIIAPSSVINRAHRQGLPPNCNSMQPPIEFDDGGGYYAIPVSHEHFVKICKDGELADKLPTGMDARYFQDF